MRSTEAVGFEIVPQRSLAFGLGIFSAVKVGKILFEELKAEEIQEIYLEKHKDCQIPYISSQNVLRISY